MNGIFYFSGTGNSLWLAKQIKTKLGGEIRYIPEWNGDISAYDKLIIVCPVYSFGLPIPVFDFMNNIKTNAPLWIVMNYGGAAGGAARFAYNHAKSCGLNIKQVYTMKMPENFTAVFSTPFIKPYNNGLLKKAPRAIGKIISSIEKLYLPISLKSISFTMKTKATGVKWVNVFLFLLLALSAENALKTVL